MRTFAIVMAAAALSGCAGTPRGMVAFYNLTSCPRGWTEAAEWNGRYVVAGGVAGQLVGQPLAPGENRVTGDHGHSVGQAFHGARENRDNRTALYGDYGYVERPLTAGGATPRNPGETVTAGTNAPYVTLRACQKS